MSTLLCMFVCPGSNVCCCHKGLHIKKKTETADVSSSWTPSTLILCYYRQQKNLCSCCGTHTTAGILQQSRIQEGRFSLLCCDTKGYIICIWRQWHMTKDHHMAGCNENIAGGFKFSPTHLWTLTTRTRIGFQTTCGVTRHPAQDTVPVRFQQRMSKQPHIVSVQDERSSRLPSALRHAIAALESQFCLNVVTLGVWDTVARGSCTQGLLSLLVLGLRPKHTSSTTFIIKCGPPFSLFSRIVTGC